MAKEKIEERFLAEIPETVKEEVVPVPAAPTKRFTFEQWAGQRNIKAHHKSGLLAYCKNPNKLKTLEEWDKSFENY